ncbi:hypothetical protein IPdc08_00748 [archaeon]|nr:hypothetical protein IPdc08_00748 [archaeon]
MRLCPSAVFLLLMFIYFIEIQNYLAITSMIVVIGIYVTYSTRRRDKKEKDHEIAEKTRDNLVILKETYKKCSYLIENGLIKKESNDSVFQLMSSESFTNGYNNYTPDNIKNFVIAETPEILEEHRKLMEQLSKYVLHPMDSLIKNKNKTKNEIDSIIQKCDYEISRLNREYGLDPVKQEQPRPPPSIA